MSDLKGIDVSEHQKNVDYAALGKSIDFVILRCSKRMSLDEMWHTHVAGFRKANVPIKGVYHFIYAHDIASAKAEAEFAVKTVEAEGFGKDLTIWADFEYDTITKAKRDYDVKLGPAECRSFTKAFCDTVKSLGHPTGIYTNNDFVVNYYGDSFLKDYDVWFAWYNQNKASRKHSIWQYSSKGRLPGYNYNLDMDIIFNAEKETVSQTPVKETPANTKIQTVTDAINKVLGIAEAEEGYHEKASAASLDSKTANSGSNNYTKYGKVMHSVQPSNMDYPAQWCDCFVDYCIYIAFGADLGRKVLCGTFDDYTVLSANYYKQAGRWYTSGQRGDQIFFQQASAGGICHTGLVREVKNGRVYCVEGNKDNAVRFKEYSIYDSYIAGYGRPKYELTIGIAEKGNSSSSSNADQVATTSTSNKLNTVPLWVGKVTASQLNVRSWAGTEYPNIKSYPLLGKDNLIDVCSTVYSAANEPWYYVRIAGKYYGFVSAKYIVRA